MREPPPPKSLVERLQLSPFYKQWLDVSGLPVLASESVAPAALGEAAFIIRSVLKGREDILKALIAAKVRVAVMGYAERTCDIPEHSDLTPKDYWNRRARGLGATKWRPAVSGAEENLLGYPGDPYIGVCVFLHEFCHGVHELGLNAIDPTFQGKLQRCFDAAMAQGLWKGTYSATALSEYWAEGAQSWFDCNRQPDPKHPDSSHNGVWNREALQTYDPELAALLSSVFRKNPWRYKPIVERLSEKHLRGYDPKAAPTFRW